MTLDLVEKTVRARIHALADSLPVDPAADWKKVVDRHRLEVDQHVNLWPITETIRRRRSYRRPALIGIVAAVTVVAATVGLLTLDSGPAAGTPTLPEPLPFTHGGHDAAVALLQRAATLQQGATVGAGPVRYAKTQNYALQIDVGDHIATTTVETTIREVWVALDGTALAKSALQDTTRAGAPVGSPSAEGTDDHWQDINSGLPDAPNAIAAALLGPDANGTQRDLILAQQVMAHLGQGTTTPAQTASLYTLLANLPDVFDAGTVTDNAGRTGHAIGVLTGHFDSGRTCVPVSGGPSSIDATLAAANALGQGLTYLVLDPVTGQPLQVEAVDTPTAPCALDLPAQPTIEQYNVILKAGQVATTGAAMR